MSGSSTLTFLPGLARSGSTHSLLGLAKTLPELEEVSLLPPAPTKEAEGDGAGGAIDAVEDDATDVFDCLLGFEGGVGAAERACSGC